MKIKVIDHGAPDDRLPVRAHDNDVGADVYALRDYIVDPNSTARIPLGFGLELPAGFGAWVFPRSSMAAKGVICELPPLDPGYTGEMHAVVHNGGHETCRIYKGDRIGQLVILPVVLADFVRETGPERGAGAFGSSGR